MATNYAVFSTVNGFTKHESEQEVYYYSAGMVIEITALNFVRFIGLSQTALLDALSPSIKNDYVIDFAQLLIDNAGQALGQVTAVAWVEVLINNDTFKPVLTASTSTVANITSSATVITLLAANTDRKGYKIQNNADTVLHLKEGATATIANATVSIAVGGFYDDNTYNGIVTGIWAGAPTGDAYTTETSV